MQEQIIISCIGYFTAKSNVGITAISMPTYKTYCGDPAIWYGYKASNVRDNIFPLASIISLLIA